MLGLLIVLGGVLALALWLWTLLRRAARAFDVFDDGELVHGKPTVGERIP